MMSGSSIFVVCLLCICVASLCGSEFINIHQYSQHNVFGFCNARSIVTSFRRLASWHRDTTSPGILTHRMNDKHVLRE